MAGDVGQYLRATASYTDGEGLGKSARAVSANAVQAVANVAATGTPTISGTVQVGQVLTAGPWDIADANGPTSPTYSYQWRRPTAVCRCPRTALVFRTPRGKPLADMTLSRLI